MRTSLVAVMLMAGILLAGCTRSPASTTTPAQTIAATAAPTREPPVPAAVATVEPTDGPSVPPAAATVEPTDGPSVPPAAATVEPTATSVAEPAPRLADVTAVKVSGEPGSYTFSVTIASPDTGCDRYADWWELVGEDGALLYRRILAHSHVGEQPFTRSGGPVAIDPESAIWVRAHMAPGGYGGSAMHGSVAAGFEPSSPPAGFGAGLESAAPQPDGCAF